MDQYKPGVGLSAGSLMVRYNVIDQHINENSLRLEGNVNLFINLESVLKNLSTMRGLASLISYYKQQVSNEIISSILNLVAHYRSYCRKMKCDPKVYLYYTDLMSDRTQEMKVYNRFYRDSYFKKYMTNPAFRAMGDLMTSIVIPEVDLILQYIPNCYLLRSKGFDGSVIPYIISESNGYPSIIVSGDIYDSLYMFYPTFITLYVRRKYNYFKMCSNIEDMVNSILKDIPTFDSGIFNSEFYYKLLMAVKGSKVRNIKGAYGLDSETLINTLKGGINKGIVLKDFASIESIIQLFPDKWHDDIRTSFQCCDIDIQYSLLSDADKMDISDQIIDKIDNESLLALNNKRFIDAPLNLQGLLE